MCKNVANGIEFKQSRELHPWLYSSDMMLLVKIYLKLKFFLGSLIRASSWSYELYESVMNDIQGLKHKNSPCIQMDSSLDG